eukprot:6174198-Pleurochrysis_carterae.AAC.1
MSLLRSRMYPTATRFLMLLLDGSARYRKLTGQTTSVYSVGSLRADACISLRTELAFRYASGSYSPPPKHLICEESVPEEASSSEDSPRAQ